MSDDSIEFGGFGSTSTHPPVKPKLKPKLRSRTTAKPLTKQKVRGVDQKPGNFKRPAGNAVAKPSKRKKVENEIVLESEDNEVEESGGGSDEKLKVQVKEERVVTHDDIASSGEDDMRVKAEEHLKNINGTKSKGRVKGRTQIQHKNPPSSKQSLKAMEVQASEEESMAEESMAEESMAEDMKVSSPQQTRPRKAISGRGRAQVKRHTKGVDDIIRDGIDDLILKVRRPAGASSQTSGASSAKDVELARLKEKIGWLENKNKVLSNQLEEQFRIRETETEALLERTGEQYQAKVHALEEINQTLREQLAKKQPLFGLGKPSVLNFITRQVADAEKQTLDKEIVKLKGEVGEAEKKLLQRDQEIGELKQVEKELRFELKAEIDRAKQVSRNPVPRSGMVQDSKSKETIRLYEDMTNIVILNVRSTPVDHGMKDEWYYTCCYTRTDESNSVNPVTRSLSFTLRSYDEDVHSTGWIQYLPTSLEQETEDFRQKLGIFSTPFQFEKVQLALFLQTLYGIVGEIVKADDGNESDDGRPEQDRG